MNIFPPSGYGPTPLDGEGPQWTRWFAWFPVLAETDRGAAKVWRHWVWLRWVECRETPDAPPPNDAQRMQFRLPQMARPCEHCSNPDKSKWASGGCQYSGPFPTRQAFAATGVDAPCSLDQFNEDMDKRSRRSNRRWLVAIAIGIVGLICLWLSAGHAHDHSRPELTPWLKSLHAKDKTWCCDGKDTDAIEEWETKGNGYRVKFRGEWFDVPEGSVVDGPNNGGDALLWMNKGYSGVSVRCFMPGPLT